MIKTKSRTCKGVNSKKHPQNMRAGYYYNPALQNLRFTNYETAQRNKIK